MTRAVGALMTPCKQCGRSFEPPPSAPHKQFCSAACRGQWWTSERQRGAKALAEAQQVRASAPRRAILSLAQPVSTASDS